MAEVYSWAEGSAYFWTGGSSTSALVAYARNITLTRKVTYQKYKPPHATVYTNYPIGSAAQLTIGQLYTDPTMQKVFNSASGGGLHVHLKNLIGATNQSGGVFLYSGNFDVLDISMADNQIGTVTMNSTFPSWGDY